MKIVKWKTAVELRKSIIQDRYIRKDRSGNWKETPYLLPPRSCPVSQNSSPMFRPSAPASWLCTVHIPTLRPLTRRRSPGQSCIPNRPWRRAPRWCLKKVVQVSQDLPGRHPPEKRQCNKAHLCEGCAPGRFVVRKPSCEAKLAILPSESQVMSCRVAVFPGRSSSRFMGMMGNTWSMAHESGSD